ncbi:fascin [Lingula anatina]|uniref:Fascin n=1 Tax=Lingula anatina TaxID=7574 RepID=A0A1S3KDV9_LINAN|nr:fascin [Lingula anatina]|eukprot:XP_013420441.1 fascin [Lingula anatina]
MAMNGVSGHDTMNMKVGLLNRDKKYLTAESFGCKINASGTSLKKKQVWTIEQDKRADVVYIRSHLGRYLSGDKNGNVKGESEEPGEDEQFIIEYAQDGSGCWAFKNAKHGYYFGGSEDQLRCYEKSPTDKEWWTVHLAIHPQVNLMNVNRNRYARLNAEAEEIHCDEVIPWGQDALITIEFRDNRYAVKTCDNRYLHREGRLVGELSADTLYTLEMKSGQHSGIAFKDSTGRYLTNVGSFATMKARNKTISKDELYLLQDSHPQVTLTGHNGRFVSIKQGVDLTANQDDVTDKESFQIEFDKKTKCCRFRTVDNKFWTIGNANGIQGAAKDTSPKVYFDLEWHSNGFVSLKASNNSYVTARMNGSLYAVSDTVTDKEKFMLTLVNRPILVLKGQYGFVGFKTPNSPKLDCARSVYDIITLSQNPDGTYCMKAPNGNYLAVTSDGSIAAENATPYKFILELREHSKFAIKAENGCYLKGEQNGIFSATGTEINANTLWEY